MTALRKRTSLHKDGFNRWHPMAKAFLAPQRDRVAPVQHPKPRCGMCGGKVHTKTDYRAQDECRGFPYFRRGDAGWWLCKACDDGPEVGLYRAA